MFKVKNTQCEMSNVFSAKPIFILTLSTRQSGEWKCIWWWRCQLDERLPCRRAWWWFSSLVRWYHIPPAEKSVPDNEGQNSLGPRCLRNLESIEGGCPCGVILLGVFCTIWNKVDACSLFSVCIDQTNWDDRANLKMRNWRKKECSYFNFDCQWQWKNMI